jgi:hypothetical protein
VNKWVIRIGVGIAVVALTAAVWTSAQAEHPAEWFTALGEFAIAGVIFFEVEGSRKEFIATHRPRLRVRNVVVKPASITGYHPTLFHPGELVGGQITIANFGNSAAHVTEAHCEVFVTHVPLPMERPYEGKNGNSPIRPVIEAGSSVPLQFQSDFLLSERQSDDILQGGNHQLYVLGWVEYRDKLGIGRRTAFCRKYDWERRRLHAVEDPDYEHEE